MRKIFVFIFSIIILLFSSLPVSGKKKDKTNEPDTIPLYNGVMVGVDLVNPISMMFGSRYSGLEASVDVDLKHRYFPVFEIGGGSYSKTKNELDFDTKGGFARLGLNYNIFNNSQADNFGFVGVRYGYGFSSFDYKNIHTSNDYWNTENTSSNILDQKAHTHWGEAVGGLRVHIFRRLYMGWTFRYKFRIWQSSYDYGEPYYVPGYGKNGGKTADFTYSIYYRFF